MLAKYLETVNVEDGVHSYGRMVDCFAQKGERKQIGASFYVLIIIFFGSSVSSGSAEMFTS